jgi:hypothetical protein
MSNPIKEMFYNAVGFNTAEITLKTNNRFISLYYHLNDNPVQHIWQGIHQDSKKFTMGITHGKSIEELVNDLNLLLKKRNRSTIELPVSQDQLNKLHSEFVGNLKPFSSEDELTINLLIHAIESKNSLLTEYDATTHFYKNPDNVKIPIKEEYKLWLLNENKWGHLLLGFGTLGKSWNEIMTTNDNLDDLNIQSDISSETMMVFNSEYPYAKAPEKKLYAWAKSSNNVVPLDNLNQLSLGNYLLGQVIITDVFLDFHPTISDWYVPNHYCKLPWNKEVLGYNATVESIKFFNSDMHFDTALNHANLGSLCLK